MESVSKTSASARTPQRGEPAALPPAQSFRREGDYWTIVYAGNTVRVRDSIGLHYLVHLLKYPHQRFAVAELLAAVKHNGAADPELARSAVSKRIRAAIERIAQHHQALGYHLSTTVKTGYACGYLPDPTQAVPWDV